MYLNGQRVGTGNEESMEEGWSNPNRDDHMSDLMLISCTDNGPTDVDNTLMQISISGRPTCSVKLNFYAESTEIYSPQQFEQSLPGYLIYP
jgi:hypothetical protein